ncbi:MAG TPA: hypothetical protein VFI47_26720 [Acidimicrobiales bacterium]|nr:hypothetical protein [Acidimicrobiales bacterium]
MTDDEFLAALEVAAGVRAESSDDAIGPLAHLGHVDHLRMMWILTTRLGRTASRDRAAALLSNLAARHGMADRYHETLTTFWARTVAHAQSRCDAAGIGDLLDRHPALLDKNLALRHYRAETLWSDAARTSIVEPDLLPIPA